MICPSCGAQLDLDPCCAVEEPTYRALSRTRDTAVRRVRLAAAALCPRCEYCVELSKEAR